MRIYKTCGTCKFYHIDEDGPVLHCGQCLCPVPPHFKQQYNTVFANDPTNCPCWQMILNVVKVTSLKEIRKWAE